MLKRLIPAAAVRELVLCLACLSWCAIAFYGRGFLLGETRWHFMGWNLFLAAVPFGLSFAMRYWFGSLGRWLLVLPWLLFLPNAPYVATDIIHLTNKSTASPWHDLLFLLSCAASGMVIGYLSLRHVHEIVEETTNRWFAWLTVTSVLTLSAFGIYLGRFLRWNSWDLATQPKSLLMDIVHRVTEPQHYTKAWAFTLALTVMLGLGYGTLELLRAPTNASSKPRV